MSVMLLQPPRLSVWRSEHFLATSNTLASVMFLQNARSSDWSFKQRLATSNTLASVILLGELQLPLTLRDWRFEHRLATSDTLASVMFLHPKRLSVRSLENLSPLNMINISSSFTLLGNFSSSTPDMSSHSVQREFGTPTIRRNIFPVFLKNDFMSHTFGSF